MGSDSQNRAPCAEIYVRKDRKSGGEALRTALLGDGPGALSDDELLAILLGFADVSSAAELRRRLGDLMALLRAPVGALLKTPGLGPARTSRLIAAVALVERSAQAGLKALPVLSSSSAVRRFLRLKLAHQPREVFACLFLDNRHRLIRFEPLFYGTVDRASVHPREVLRRALELNAAAVILAHNHPSGIAEPSASDLALTQDLTDLLKRIEVRVLDHLVVGRGTEVSFAERGFMGL
ncbi:MAG: JAB domain-containing protein [Gammaproteobacteria bacterium]|nr:MAG: JAB domain-containing protein [Gammaproteobacteria bacterium]